MITWHSHHTHNHHPLITPPKSPPQRIYNTPMHTLYIRHNTYTHTHTRQQTTRNRFNSFYQFICHIYMWNKTITIVNFSTSSEIWAHLIIMTSEIRNIDVNISAKPEKPPLSKFFWKILKFTKKMLIYIQTYIDSNFEKNNVNSLWFFV